ncbi:class I SAM-dependent methyltransferase [Acinetobacter guillouiae]|uniref:Class I SAM-dependent methyltransferase n=1 Tax=Acinetobacter guillouiae TaxID=106649 RepID=A0A8X8KF95_ACIGI|nr:class I SAM-dependent methyltransferase [Acinetobacter guillouiae]MCF0264800.1 class I SAM-dependent methyltransferase [Acinetobacter guillouiae]
MTHSLHPAAQKGFSTAAELYQQVRPNYPQDVVKWLKEDLALGPDSSVVDLGAGTGKFLPYLKQATPNIIAVEPVTEMLEQLKIVHPDVQTLQAKSDQIPLESESIDAVLCAQSFHWFANIETLNEIHHILKPEGHLGLIWNQRDETIDWVKALADLLATIEGDTPRYHSGQWKLAFENQFLFQLETAKVFSQVQTGTVENVVSKRLLSTSFIAAMPEQQQLTLKHKFEHIVLEYTGKHAQDEIDFPYVTYVYNFRKLR